MEIMCIDTCISTEDCHVYAIVIVNVVHLHAVVVVGLLIHLVGGGIHLDIAMITIIPRSDDGISFDGLSLIKRYGMFDFEHFIVGLVNTLDKFHLFSILVDKLENVV